MKVLRFAFTASLFVLMTVAGYAQTADEIVSKYVTAIGGADNWKKVTSITSTGKMTVQGADVDLEIIVLNGKGGRQNITAMGMSGYQIVTPTAGWSFMPFQGQQKPEPMTEESLKESADSYDAQGTLVDYKAKGHTVEYLGKEDIEGTECHKLKVTQKSGKVETVYIDPASFLAVRSITKQKANGQEMEVITNMSNYQKLPEGISVPMSLVLPFGELTLSKVEVNKPVDESIFKPAN